MPGLPHFGVIEIRSFAARGLVYFGAPVTYGSKTYRVKQEGGCMVSKELRIRTRHSALGLVAGAVVLAMVSGCSEGAASSAPSIGPRASPDIPEVLATIGDEKVTLADIRSRAGDQLDQLDTQYQKARSKTLETALQEILRERVLDAEAKRQGKSIEELLAAEAGGSLEPSEIEISSWYADNQGRTGGRPLDQLRPQIADLLRQERRREAEKKLESRLSLEKKVVVNFEPYRIAFNNEKAASLGKPGAPVTVVEFSDFQCPFCRQFAPTLRRLEKDFGDQVYVVYRQYPITSIHPFAFKAAEASLCANEQGKFWELHDMMFAEQERLAVTDLKEKARRLGMDEKAFNTCLDTGRFAEQVQNDTREALRVGATGTPALFVNGVQLEGGAVSYDVVADAIKRELAKPPAGR